MVRKDKLVDPKRKAEKVFKFLKEIGFTSPADLEANVDADIIVPIYFEALVRFVEPMLTGLTDAGLREAVHQNILHLDGMLAALPSARLDGKSIQPSIACKKGCSYCCSIRVTTTAPVVIAMAYYLKKKLSYEELSALGESLQRDTTSSEQLASDELVSRRGSVHCWTDDDGLAAISHDFAVAVATFA